MKRYTFFTDDYPVVTCKHCYEDQNENYTGPAIDRLAEYEATGLMPAEVAALQYQLKHIRREQDDATNQLIDLRMQQRWIPVSERLPAENVRVLICYIDGGGSRGINTDTRHWNRWLCFGGELATVTHWMPLPEPPKEDVK